MSKPNPTGNPGNTLVTSAIIYVDGSDVGFASKVAITGKEMTTEIMTDQLGKAPINHVHVGDQWQVEMELDEITATKMKKAYTHGTFLSSGGATRIGWGKPIGGDYYSLAKELLVVATADDTTNISRRFRFYKATPVGDSKLEYGPDKMLKIKTTFHCYPDLTKPNGEWYGYYGDTAAGSFVPAAAGAPVAGGGNVGNGTVTGVGVNDTFTKTETWTLTCIHTVVNGGIFSVVGSVTGARGNATVGSVFYSNTITPANSEILFTINDGATDFALGDTFTIATTQANFT